MHPTVIIPTISFALLRPPGTVVLSGKENDELLHKRVFLTPMRGWESAPDAPEDPKKFSILGGADHDPLGTFAEYAVVDRKEVILTPSHVTDVQMAAWPVAAVTAWRSVPVLDLRSSRYS